jgi:hypothetical protein
MEFTTTVTNSETLARIHIRFAVAAVHVSKKRPRSGAPSGIAGEDDATRDAGPSQRLVVERYHFTTGVTTMSSPRKSARPVPPLLPPMGVPSANPPTASLAQRFPAGFAVTPGKCLEVVEENDTHRNIKFLNRTTGVTTDLPETVRAIEDGLLPDYYVREINGVKTPVSMPDQSESNNLG